MAVPTNGIGLAIVAILVVFGLLILYTMTQTIIRIVRSNAETPDEDDVGNVYTDTADQQGSKADPSVGKDAYEQTVAEKQETHDVDEDEIDPNIDIDEL